MIVLDTNIVSVLLVSNHPDLPIIEKWMDASIDKDFRITSISKAEVEYGIEKLPDGAKKSELRDSADEFFRRTEEATLIFGTDAPAEYGRIMAKRRSDGHPISVLDAQIAAMASVNEATVATRNTKDFLDCGVTVVNPYDYAA